MKRILLKTSSGVTQILAGRKLLAEAPRALAKMCEGRRVAIVTADSTKISAHFARMINMPISTSHAHHGLLIIYVSIACMKILRSR